VSVEEPRVEEQTSDAARPQPRVLAPLGRRLLAVTENESLGAYCVLKAADPDGPEPAPGQFAMLAAAERWGAGEEERPYVPRAFSYARFQDGEAHFLLEDVGPGTHRLCELGQGDGLWLLGPLGQGFTAPEKGRRALLVGGGVGIAALAIWQDKLKAGEPYPDDAPHTGTGLHSDRSCPTVLLGFRDSAHSEGAALLEEAILASDDGSVGHHGRVTELLRAELDRDTRATVYACGPPPMLESVRALCAERDVPAQLALEAGMACGFGACYGCVVPTREGYVRVCVDGPVIDAAELEHIETHAASPR
jgi:dihydroorotate dehydrogenase electron transfer subunit